MKEFTFTIRDELGLHARPAGMLVKTAGKFASKVTIRTDTAAADGKKILAVMKLAAKHGTALQVACEGPDEEAAAAALQEFLNASL